ncbi:transglycosylase SLT domain-containing protein [Candidatus Ferrigenium straubiae]|uniref:transglycosylase SLT domain-containing protein n=1 Tax=Candidatus Ferrigenium straubiae TaxID=2919506 RepID=UPI003F4AC24C
MPLIRRIFFALLAVCTLATPAVQAEEQLALSTSPAATPAPLKLSTARNIELELISDSELAARDLWARIRNGFSMRDLDSPLVARHEKWYASRPDYVARMTERARRYLYHITVEVERRGMPSEIALLPMIESAFNPGAYSTSRASGIWQFIPSTGKNFGMQQNWWYDGRRDVISATNGALDYLQKLHDMFGDWELALAAYNWGEGAVQRAQARNRKRRLPVNYTSLKMPNETRNYVPKLLAVKNIVANPASFGLVLEDIPDNPYFAAVSTTKHIDVKLAAQLADIPMEEFAALNPAHNRPVILQDNSDLILLPVDAVETFRANLENYDKPLVSWQAYQPKKGERLDHLAPRFGLSVETLKSVNGLSGRAKVSTGQTLLVPVNGEESEADEEFEAFNMHLSPTGDSAVKHIVRKGDTLGGIARRYHVSVAGLKEWNKGALKILRVGQAINVMQAASRKPSSRLSKSGNGALRRASAVYSRHPGT